LNEWQKPFEKLEIGTSKELKKGTKIVVLSVGHIGNMITEILEEQRNSKEIGHINMQFIKPLDTKQLEVVFNNYEHIITIEDGCKSGGFGSAVLEYANQMQYNTPVHVFGIDDTLIEHGTIPELHKIAQIDKSAIEKFITQLLNEK